MKVAIVSTYPPMECGIGTYSKKLAMAMVSLGDDVSMFIIGENGVTDSLESGIKISPVYSRNENYQDKIFEYVKNNQIEVVHFQHAPDLLGMDYRLIGLVKKLRRAGVKTVVTLHTIYNRPQWREIADRALERDTNKINDGKFHTLLAANANRIIVHQHKGAFDVLTSQGVEERCLKVIPHGTKKMELISNGEGKKQLGLDEDSFVFLFFGFIHLQKNVHTAVNAFLRIAEHYPQARLLIAGKPWGDRWYNRLYIRSMKRFAAMKAGGNQVIFHDGYVPAEKVATYYSAADVLLLPHRQKYGSASGVFHQTIGAKKPLIVSQGPKFSDGIELMENAGMEFLSPAANNPTKWANAMSRLLEESEVYSKASTVLSSYATESSWENVARKQLELYKELLDGTK